MRLVFRLALAILAIASAVPAQAADDCAPLPRLPTYEAAGAPERHAWDAIGLATADGPVTIAGRTCVQHFAPMAGTDAAGDLEIHGFYRDALRAAGAEVVLAEDQVTVARLRRDGGETWLRVASQDKGVDVVVVEQAPHPQVLTAPSGYDYEPLGHMPDYVADTPEWRAFDQRDFSVRDGDDTREQTVQGVRLEVDYALRDGATPASDRDIQENYRTALRAAGAEILFTDERNTTARLDRNGQAIWFKIWSEETAINVTVVEQGPHRPTLRPADGNDQHRLGHMPGYRAEAPEKHGLDDVIFPLADGAETRDTKVQGQRIDLTYAPRPGVMPASDLDIQLNYRAALAALGAQILFTDSATTLARYLDGGALVWVKVWSQETTITLTFVEETPFKSNVRPIPAETLRAALEGRGRAGLYLAFDFNRPTLRPDAVVLLAEVARMLRETPDLRLLIENHTDNIGPRELNLALSAARAESVRAALAAFGVDPARLDVAGIGPDRPLSDDATSEGRARNRRTVLIRR